jgi:RES domain-containing protein
VASQGVSVVYTSESLSLAALETWVHVDRSEELASSRIHISADIPDDVTIHHISEASLPQDWRRIDAPVPALRSLGTEWIQSNQSAVARVPGVVTPGEFNYLLNPNHREFGRIRQGNAMPFEYDPRMKK